MTTETIYVPLLDEGVDVWRPVPAHRVEQDVFVILRPDSYDPSDESWEFPPGSIVRCRNRQTSGGTVLAAYERLNTPKKQTA
jgi:hypothetical protein